MSVMKIKRNVLEKIIAQSEQGYPYEICGIIASTNGEQGDVLYKMKNISDNPKDGYFMDPAEQLKIFKTMRNKDESLFSIYHSHIDVGAYMSERDKNMAYYKDIFYLVISVKKGKVDYWRAFYVRGEEIKEVEVEVT